MAYPKKRDIVIIDAEPHSGKEYGGHDPKNKNISPSLIKKLWKTFISLTKSSFIP